MQIINAGHKILSSLDGDLIIHELARIARICYKSNYVADIEANKKFIAERIKDGHESILEHKTIIVKFVCDRGVSHELVRHRLASFTQESTRYCNYTADKFNNELTFIKPRFWDEHSEDYKHWLIAMQTVEHLYKCFINTGSTPEQARCILPNSLKTEIIMTANLREWRHILKLRTAKDAHPQMRELMCPLLKELKEKIPIIFDDIGD